MTIDTQSQAKTADFDRDSAGAQPILPDSAICHETTEEQSKNSIPVKTWQQEMKQAIRTTGDLAQRLNLTDSSSFDLDPSFPVFVPLPLLRRIEPQNLEDPILRQVLAIQQEKQIVDGFVADPLQETATKVNSQRVLKKYHGRALIVATGVCAIHCRYCFRRHFPYQALPQNRSEWSSWLDPIREDSSIHEVILSGGDPLVLTDGSLKQLTDGLRKIDHVRWLRVHTRMPVVIPARVTDELIGNLQGFASTTIVLHINHANEIDDNVRQMARRLRAAGFQLLNQSVLLSGVNDSVDALRKLSIELIESGIQPYYLHQLDRVQGAAHFEVSTSTAKKLMHQLRTQLPGHAVPQYVQEIPGQPYKTIISYTE